VISKAKNKRSKMKEETKYVARTSKPDLFGKSSWIAHWFDQRHLVIRTRVYEGDATIWDGQKIIECKSKDEVRDFALAELKAESGCPF
jgi:hypothetical protein